MSDTLLARLAAHGFWGLLAAAVLALLWYCINKGYGIKIDIGPRSKF